MASWISLALLTIAYGLARYLKKSGKLKVPASAREAIVNIGLIGGTGEVSYDDIQMRVSSADK